jgi:hypothetical protein
VGFVLSLKEQRMPRYYIRLEPQAIGDNEGEELPNPEAARQVAEAMAADLTRNRDEQVPYQQLIVSDAAGAIVYEAALVLH